MEEAMLLLTTIVGEHKSVSVSVGYEIFFGENLVASMVYLSWMIMVQRILIEFFQMRSYLPTMSSSDLVQPS